MIRRFAMVLALALLAGASIHAQQAPAGQTPTTQENPEPESTSRRKARPHDYRNWTFDVGVGANLPSGTTSDFVKGGGIGGMAGVTRNYSKYFGLRLDFIGADLPLRTQALQLAQAPTGTDYIYGMTLDPIFKIPIGRIYSAYGLVGPAFYHRSGKLDSSTVVPGSTCNAFWSWWGTCFNGSVPLNKNFLSTSQNDFGFNFGGGVARKVSNRLEIYGELRYLYGKHNGISTDLRTVTIGVRW